jgi:hypothetical protein
MPRHSRLSVVSWWRPRERGKKRIVAEPKNTPRGRGSPPSSPPGADRTPISTSGVVPRRNAPGSRPRRSEPPLEPYRARLDVEMDDTAISKVRDPSVSISLSAEGLLPLPEPPRSPRKLDAVYSIALGTLLGALLVVLAVIAARVLGQ